MQNNSKTRQLKDISVLQCRKLYMEEAIGSTETRQQQTLDLMGV
jgi:hypothetical protein